MLNKIIVLEPETAKRIAAGEVIDRPSSSLRELLDNSIDSGASSISVEIEKGGIEKLRVRDNGSGMSKEDLELSILPHATSKIKELDDLLSLSTLGFRGEALSSMASVAELEIKTGVNNENVWLLSSFPGKEAVVNPCSGEKGTSISIKNIFASFPARKKFLKMPNSEALSCRSVFIDKAIAYPEIEFKLIQDGKSSLFLPKTSRVERVVRLISDQDNPDFFRELIVNAEHFSARIIISLPDIFRTDKKNMQVFVNGRRIMEYGIIQAVMYAYHGALPGGAFPYAYVFLTVDPKFADFNIHPAKKEVRLTNIDEIRSGIIRAIKDFLSSHERLTENNFIRNDNTSSPDLFEKNISVNDRIFRNDISPFKNDRVTWNAIANKVSERKQTYDYKNPPIEEIDNTNEKTETENENSKLKYKYLGIAFDVFIIFEMNDKIFILDQHAVHERLLFEQLRNSKVVVQELLVPFVYDTDDEKENNYIMKNIPVLAKAGYKIRSEGSSFVLEGIPSILPESMTSAIFEFIKTSPDKDLLKPEDLLYNLFATTACRAAVKAGDVIDENMAKDLIEKAFTLKEFYCPHGRPIWKIITKEQLYKDLKRLL